MNLHQFNRVLLHVRFELDRFESTLSRLEANQFPSRVAKILIDDQKREANVANVSLTVIETDFDDDPPGASARLSSEYRKLRQRRSILEILEKSRSDEVPWSLVPSIERLALDILPDRPILVTTTPDMNYMVSWSQSSHEPVVTIYLPKLHRSNAFLYVLIGHELFHPAIEPFILEEMRIISPKLHEVCRKTLAESEGEPDLFSQQRVDALINFAMTAWERGLTESMCDMGAAAIFGPAALWTSQIHQDGETVFWC